MADSSNYIGVAMGLDVSDLKAGLADANKQIQLANSEFKAASSGMEDWTKSTEGLSAKVKQLDTVLSMQKSKLAGLNAEYEETVKKQGANSEAARKLKVQINNQQAVVNKTQKEFDNYSDTLKQAEAGTIDLNAVTLRGGKAYEALGAKQKKAKEETEELTDAIRELKEETGEASNEAEESAGAWGKLGKISAGIVGGIAAIGAAAAGAVTGFLSLAESTRETRENMNKLETGFTTAGLTAKDATETYKTLYSVLGDEGQATEASAHLAQLANSQEDLAKWTDIATGIYGTFGASLPIEGLTEAANETAKTGSLTGSLADALNWAGVSEDEFQAKLDAASSEQERQALITETLNGLYSEQSATFKELNGDIMASREADASLSQSLAELGAIAEPIMTSLKLLAVDLLETIKPFVELIGTGLKGALEGTAGSTDILAQGLSGILSTLGEKIVGLLPTVLSTLATLVTTLLPQLLSTVSGLIPPLISTLAAQLPVILQAIISGFSQILTSIGSMLPSLIPIIIDAVLMIVATLLDNIDQLIDAGISLLMGLADGLIAALPQLISKIPVIIEKLLGAISRNLPKLLASGIELLLSLREGLMDAIPELIKAIPDIIKSIVKALAEGIPDLLSAGKDMLEGLFEGFLDPDVIWKKVKALGESIVDAAKSFFGISSPSKLMRDEIGEFLGEGVGVGMIDSLPRVKKNLNQFGNFITDNLGGIKNGLSLGVSGAGAYAGAGAGAGGRVVNIDARQTLQYNGNMSLKEVKQREREHYVSIKTKLRAEGLV